MENVPEDVERPVGVLKKQATFDKETGLTFVRSIKQYFQEYCNSSSIHGIRYMGEKGRSGMER